MHEALIVGRAGRGQAGQLGPKNSTVDRVPAKLLDRPETLNATQRRLKKIIRRVAVHLVCIDRDISRDTR